MQNFLLKLWTQNKKGKRNQDSPLTPLRNVQHKPEHHLGDFIGAAGGGPVHLHGYGQHPLQVAYDPDPEHRT